jgi:hypothetical protein
VSATYEKLFDPFLTSEPNEKGDHESYCPAHEDPANSHKPSARLNFSNEGYWYCFVCTPEGKAATLGALARVYRKRLKDGELEDPAAVPPGARVVNLDARRQHKASRTSRPKRDLPTPMQVAGWTAALLADPERLAWLRDVRGLTPDTIKARGLGWCASAPPNGRYVIPCYNEAGALYDCRMYDPDNQEDRKYLWWRGSQPDLYGAEMLAGEPDWILLLEGELDQALGQQDELPALSHSAGAATWRLEWSRRLVGRHVVICYDNDKGGRQGREKVKRALENVAAGVYFVTLPQEGADYTDYRIKYGASVKDFLALVHAARQQPRAQNVPDKELPTGGQAVSLSESQNAERNKQPLELVVTVMGKQEPAYNLPRKVEFTCDQGKGTPCKTCPMAILYDGKEVRTYPANDPLVRSGIETTDTQMLKALRTDVRAKCGDHLDIDVVRFWSVEHLVVTDSVDSQRASDEVGVSNLVRSLYNVGTYATPVNTLVRVVGEQLPGPKDQRGVIYSWLTEGVASSIDKFQMTPDLAEALRVYQPADGQSPLDKCREIAEDEAHHVTHIYGRPLLHVAYGLVWHSPLEVTLLGDRLSKGWLEMAVLGDSRTGKSEAATHLASHYQAGLLYSCDQASLAGLVGGLHQPAGNHWMIRWGAIPLNDRHLIILDEAQSLVDTEIISHMSSIRSSGKAQIQKIVSSETTARTRLIWIANPPSGSQLSSLPDGAMDALRQLMPQHEDIARFDFAMAAARDEVPDHLINTTDHGAVPPHVYIADLARALVGWAWSRKAAHIQWTAGTEDYLLRKASEVGSTYTSDFPLVQKENVRTKLARLAAALAVRTFSTDQAGEAVVIRKVHVASAVKFLHEIYENEMFGYARLSRRVLRDTDQASGNLPKVRDYLSGKSKRPDTNGRQVAKALAGVGGRFELRSFAEAASMRPEDAMIIMRFLEDQRLVRRVRGGRWIEPQSQLTALIRDLEDTDTSDKPEDTPTD